MVDFIEEAKLVFEDTRKMRRDFHMHPELGFQEERTSGIVAAELRKLGIDVVTGVGKTGVVGLLEGKKKKPVLLLRFDMDALPVTEENDVLYVSLNKGIMHACGHDAHTAIGLSVARILSSHRDELQGTIKFVFQPAEEGQGGAQAMVKDGVLENPVPDYSLAMHVWNEKPIGWMGITSGPAMAAAETFTIRINGRGGHGASPHQTVDPVYIASQVVVGLQSIISRNVNPMETGVISATSIHGGETFNVIPQWVEICGTIRTFTPSTRALVLRRLREVADGVASTYGASAEVTIESITPTVNNDPALSKRVYEIAKTFFPDFDFDRNKKTMGSEDMAFLMETVPGCFVFVGSSNPEKGLNAEHHHPRFDFDEEVLQIGTALIAGTAFRLLQQG